MTFSYSGNPGTSTRDAIRFYCQDINVDDQFLTDEEIDFIITSWANVSEHPLYLSAVACETISSRFARDISYSADGLSVGAGELQNKYKQLAQALRDQYKAIDIGGGPDIGGIMLGEVYDTDIKPLTWAKGMHDNIEAGQQDYGGVEPAQFTYPEKDGSY
jgi:hypothetical protein